MYIRLSKSDLYPCHNGKETSIVSAFILYSLGYDDTDFMDDDNLELELSA